MQTIEKVQHLRGEKIGRLHEKKMEVKVTVI